MPSESTEMYLVTVYRLTRQQAETTIRQIADQLGVAVSSTSEKVRTLTEQGYLLHPWREGVSLTEEGTQIALHVLYKNRLASTFLVRTLGYRLDEAFEDACYLEHAITDRMAERLAAFLGHPAVDPFGQPLLAHGGTSEQAPFVSLLDAPVGQTVLVDRLETLEAERLGYLHTIGLLPGTLVTVAEMVPFEGPLLVGIGGQTVALARPLAAEVGVVIEHTKEAEWNSSGNTPHSFPPGKRVRR
jgi:DtxR family Mn-dependent transcriptional regulator